MWFVFNLIAGYIQLGVILLWALGGLISHLRDVPDWETAPFFTPEFDENGKAQFILYGITWILTIGPSTVSCIWAAVVIWYGNHDWTFGGIWLFIWFVLQLLEVILGFIAVFGN